jgi:hypothetical protein
LKRAIIIVSVAAFILFGIGTVITLLPGGPYPAGLPFTIRQVQGGLVVQLGVFLAVVSAILCAIDAFRRRDWLALSASVMLALLGLVGGPYLLIAVSATNQGGASGSGAPVPGLLGVATAFIVLGLPLATLLYGLVIERPMPRAISVGGLAALTLGAILVAAPPWIVFDPSNGAPVLTIDSPQGSADCAHGQYPPITIRNTGGGTVNWRFAVAAFDAVTTTPSSGSLTRGQTQVVTLVGAYAPSAERPQEVAIELDSNGGNQRVTIPCGG